MAYKSTDRGLQDDSKRMTAHEQVENALSKEELDKLHPGWNTVDLTRRHRVWYNEAVWTAAALFVEAAEQSEAFRQDFMNDTQRHETIEYGDGETTTIEVDAWRDTMKAEVPEYHAKVMDIGLSAFQGGSAEQTARAVLEEQKS